MSHDKREGRPDRAARPAPDPAAGPDSGATTGPTTGPGPSEPRTGEPFSAEPGPGETTWPGPSGLGGPGSEEFPVPREPQGPTMGAGTGTAVQPERAGDYSPETARERDEYLDALLRLQADFDNYRKRVQRQQHDIIENAAATLVKKLLPVLDTADLALAHGGGEDVKQVAGTLFEILSKEGLERIDPEGQPFDPAHHDAVAHEPVEGQGAPEMPEVSEVLRAGYLWKGQVLRPAMVKVRG
jgi:molecular chaperone GrpE